MRVVESRAQGPARCFDCGGTLVYDEDPAFCECLSCRRIEPTDRVVNGPVDVANRNLNDTEVEA